MGPGITQSLWRVDVGCENICKKVVRRQKRCWAPVKKVLGAGKKGVGRRYKRCKAPVKKVLGAGKKRLGNTDLNSK